MSNSIAPGSSADVNVRVTALTTNPNVPAQYKTIILKKNLVNGVNTLTQEMMSSENIKYVIKYDYVLGENITIPENCILEFDGGSLNNGTITYNYTKVIGEQKFVNITFVNKKAFNDILVFDCVADIINYPYFIHPGTNIKTLGYYTKDDGGGADYYMDIVTSGETYDTCFKFSTVNNGTLKLVVKDSITFRQAGAKPIDGWLYDNNGNTNILDSTQYVQTLFDYFINPTGYNDSSYQKIITVVVDGTFALKTINITGGRGRRGVNIVGNKMISKIVFIGDGVVSGEDFSSIFNISAYYGVLFENISFYGGVNGMSSKELIPDLHDIAHTALYFTNPGDTPFEVRVRSCVFECFFENSIKFSSILTGWISDCCFNAGPAYHMYIEGSTVNLFVNNCNGDIYLHNSKDRSTEYFNYLLNNTSHIDVGNGGDLYGAKGLVYVGNNNANCNINVTNTYIEGKNSAKNKNSAIIWFSQTDDPTYYYPTHINIVSCRIINAFDYVYRTASDGKRGIACNVSSSHVPQKLFYSEREDSVLGYFMQGITRCLNNTISSHPAYWTFGGGDNTESGNNGYLLNGKRIDVYNRNINDLTTRQYCYGDIVLSTNSINSQIIVEEDSYYVGKSCIYPLIGKGYARSQDVPQAVNIEVLSENTFSCDADLDFDKMLNALCYKITLSNNTTRDVVLVDKVSENGTNIYTAYAYGVTLVTGPGTASAVSCKWKYFGRKTNLEHGTTGERPTESLIIGDTFFDTSLGKPIYYKGNNIWVDATGATV